jgi:hypothetical protein
MHTGSTLTVMDIYHKIINLHYNTSSQSNGHGIVVSIFPEPIL